MVQSLFLGDLTGFAALGLVGASAAIMAYRAKFMKVVGGVDPLRDVHVAVSMLAAVFLSAHIILLFSISTSVSLYLGFVAFALGLLLWASGVGFLERNKDSFYLHGPLSVAVIALVVVHAAVSGATIPTLVSAFSLVVTGLVALASASYYIRKMRVKPAVGRLG